jgi:hypothetical protein
MTRSIMRAAVIAAVLLTGVLFGNESHGQDSWNHGFGPRNYGYSGNAYAQSYSSPSGFGYSRNYVTGYTPYYGYYAPYGGYYPYGVWLGGFSSGVYTYRPAPGYYGYRPYYGPYYQRGVPRRARGW